MKKGYVKLLIFSILLIILVLCNAFIIDFLSGYKMVIFLIVLLLIFNYFFVIEKDINLYFKDIVFEIILFSIAFFILYYLLGLVVGLAKTANFLSFESFKTILIPLILYSILREIFRYNMLLKADNNMICTVIVVFLFILLDVTNAYHYTNFNTQYDTLSFIALTLLPSISKSISYSYIIKRIGYKAVIIFDLIISLYKYIFPLIPNPNEYVVSIIYLLLPILFAFKIIKFLEAKKRNKINSNYHKIRFKSILIPLSIVLILVYFYSGYFRYFVIAIATGSMEPNINKGDIVIVDKNYSYNNLEIGQVIAYKKDDVIIVHRIIKRLNIGDSYVYYTKGDANSHMDDIVIEEDMIVGIVNHKIPYLGYPTVWFNDK